MSYDTTYHNNGSVNIWDCYAQNWVETSAPSDRLLATLSEEERQKIIAHVSARKE